MQRAVRIFPVSSKEKLLELIEGVSNWPQEERSSFLSHFGNPVEEWYYQEIDGKSYVVAIAEGESLDQGFSKLSSLDDPFVLWFCERVRELSGIDLRVIPEGASSELVFRLST
ncbi:MAG: hypothetical protein AAGI11_11150 [Pseudomonadota bacterium]